MEFNQSVTIVFAHYSDGWIAGGKYCLLYPLCCIYSSPFRAAVCCNTAIIAREVAAQDIPADQFTQLYRRCIAGNRLHLSWRLHWRLRQISLKITALLKALVPRKPGLMNTHLKESIERILLPQNY